MQLIQSAHMMKLISSTYTTTRPKTMQHTLHQTPTLSQDEIRYLLQYVDISTSAKLSGVSARVRVWYMELYGQEVSSYNLDSELALNTAIINKRLELVKKFCADLVTAGKFADVMNCQKYMFTAIQTDNTKIVEYLMSIAPVYSNIWVLFNAIRLNSVNTVILALNKLSDCSTYILKRNALYEAICYENLYIVELLIDDHMCTVDFAMKIAVKYSRDSVIRFLKSL